jgi:hypothetical protein
LPTADGNNLLSISSQIDTDVSKYSPREKVSFFYFLFFFLKQHVEKTTETENYGSGFVSRVRCSSVKFTFQRCSRKRSKIIVLAKQKKVKALLATRTLLVDPI